MTSNQPLVSIIMNCYNSDKYLKEAIESVYSQDYSNWEIIFWDNASNDNSASIAQSFDSKLRYFCADKTVPLYEARNLAFEKCKGSLIAFLDCDDIWLDSKLSKQIKHFNTGSKVVYGRYEDIDGEGKKTGAGSNKLFSGFITNRLLRQNSISIGCVLMDAQLLKDNPFDSRYKLMGDYDLWLRLSLKEEFSFVADTLELSRQHGENTSITLMDQWLLERRYLYRKFLKSASPLKYPAICIYILKTELKGILGAR